MATAISLHIGLNYVDPNHYSGWNGELNAAEYDANDMSLIAKYQGFQTYVLLRSNATRQAVTSSILNAAQTLNQGDIFVISYSGHGGQLPDINGDEDDGLDETWCLYDGELVDDELSQL
ncbi:caspase family protein [Hymenobacter nivis]|uniref:caspase family protein n=1 Tax=Hymenobacter nivis TaxID=1850093 RepID=UPI001B877E38